MTATFAIGMALLAAAPMLGLVPLAGTLRARVVALASAAGCVLLVIVGLDAAIGGAHPLLNIGHWFGFGHSVLRADGMGGIFLALTGVCGAATSLAFAEVPQGAGVTAIAGLLLLAVAVAIGAANAFLFFLAWEGLGVCIYLLTSADRGDPEALLGGYFTAGLTKVGGAALLAAFGLLYGHTHTFELGAWAHAHLSDGTRGVAFLLFLVAFGSKIGLLPLQGALPAGYSAAPGFGAASLSVALSAGFYGLWRFEVVTLAPLPTWCGDLLLVLGTITACTGIVYAITQDRLRRFLGYSTIEHAGIVLLGLGVALLGQAAHDRTLAAAGLLAATLHVCAHNLAKTLALLGATRVEQASGERTLDPLGGFGRRAPLTAAALGVASLTLCAIPPLGGFVSEWMTFEALLQGFRMPALLSQLLCALAAAGLAFTAGIGLLAFAKYYGFIFLGPERTVVPSSPSGADRRKWLRAPSLWGLGFVIMFLGTVAPWEIHALGSGLRSTLGFDPAASAVTHPLVLGPVFAKFSVLAPTWLTIVLPSYAILAVLLGRYAGGRRGVRRAPVWVTGSGAELSAVQYRPSAYSNPLRVVLRGPLGFRTQVVRSSADGDEQRQLLQTSVVLAVDRFVYLPLTRVALWASAHVRRFQSGRLSTYLLYIMVALILALALIPILH
jgi:hydrogenase-4 component B